MKIQVQFYSFLLLFVFITSCSKDDDTVTPIPVPKDIYVSGYVDPTNSGQTRATYWKNGQPNYLSESTILSNSKGIYVADNGDVYVCGYIQNSNFILNACISSPGMPNVPPIMMSTQTCDTLTVCENDTLFLVHYKILKPLHPLLS